MEHPLNSQLTSWLNQHALELDQSNQRASEVLPQLVAADLLGLGVPTELGGMAQSRFSDAAWATVAIAKCSLSAAFVFWTQRSFISYVLHSSNNQLAARYVPQLLKGELAGATGLSNAIKFLAGVEQLQVQATPVLEAENKTWKLSGFLPWVSNLYPDRFVVAIPAKKEDAPPAIFLAHHNNSGLNRDADLILHSLQGSNTASIQLDQCVLTSDQLLADNAQAFIQKIRPQFLSMQCALSTGVALRSVEQIMQHSRGSSVSKKKATDIKAQVIAIQNELNEKTESGYFVQAPTRLFELRIQLATLTEQASLLELQSEGGACYLQGQREQTLRRVREALFLPLVSPTITQLQAQLA